jgi:hypothetical protein
MVSYIGTLGVYPSHRYSKSWIGQRLVNRAPEWAQIRKSPTSIGQQLLNPIALDIQDTIQQLNRERNALYASSADIKELDLLYRLDLPSNIEFTETETHDGYITYEPPIVVASINDSNYKITIAENNDILTLGYDCLPTRIEDAEVSHSYSEIIPRTLVSSVPTTSIGDLPIPGYLYITVRDNENWEIESVDTVYYCKILVTGITRKGTKTTEAVLVRYNSTFKTLNEWESISEITALYLSDTAYLTVELFPFDRDSYLDTFNILVESDRERLGFLCLEDRTYGSSLVTEGYVIGDFTIVRQGVDDKQIYREMQLLNSSGAAITAIDFVVRPNTRFAYVIDDTKLYVYDINFPFPDTSLMADESPETTMDLYSDRWVCNMDEEVYINTRTLAFNNPPTRVRWSRFYPDGTSDYIDLTGSVVSEDDAWIDNELYDNANWREQRIPLSFAVAGEHIVMIECQYWSSETNTATILKTKYMFFVPAISAETELDLPSNLQSPEKIGIDSEGNIWIRKYGLIHKLNMFHDYFLADYSGKRLWFREEYPNVEVEII